MMIYFSKDKNGDVYSFMARPTKNENTGKWEGNRFRKESVDIVASCLTEWDDIAEAAEKIIREGINTSKSIVSEKNRSVAVTTKKGTEAIVSGDQSVAISIGWRSKAKGALGCWLVLAECRSKEVIDVKSVQVDGDRIKVNTFYRLKNGEFVECKGM